MRIKKTLKKLPFSIRQSAKYLCGLIPTRLRYGKVFWNTYNFLQESQWWNKEKLEEYQMQQLSKLLHHAYENVPYYRKIFDERGLKPKDIQNFDDMKKLPCLTKKIIRENLQDLFAQNYPLSRFEYVTTGGSTGIPLGFYQERVVSSAKEWAFMITQWNRVGFKMGDKRVILRGNVIQSTNKGKFWEYNPIDKTLILSSYHMTDYTLPNYIKKINDFLPDFLHVYPSTITILARYMKENNIQPFTTVKALLCGSENIYLWQRNLLEEVFQCRVYSWYGHAEKAVLAGECEKSTNYHIFPEYGFVELIGKDGNLISREEETGEIVATSFNNNAMPIIRYKTGDLGVYTEKKCPCGRNYPLLKRIEGRLQEIVVTKDKGLITLTALIFAQHFKAFSKIKKMQLFQEKVGKITAKIVKASNYSDADENEILFKIKKASGDKLDMKIVYVDFIPSTKRGKHKFLIQRLPIEFGNN